MDELGTLAPRIVGTLPSEACAWLVEVLAAHECPALTARRARRGEASGVSHDPIVWSEARGSNVLDTGGNCFVDLSGGFGAVGVGHGHPALVAALQAQSARLVHALGDLQPSDVKVQLLQRLAALAPFPGARVILGLSGSDAVEAALKTAVLATGRPGVLAFEGAYHGLAHGPLAACGYSSAFRAPFAEQLNPHVRFVAYPANETEAATVLGRISALLAAPLAERPGAVLVEPVLGRGGVVVPPAGFLRALGEACRAAGVLVIADEVMTGMLRTGSLFESVAQGLEPDLLCLGKGLGGGVPISACLGRADVMAAWAAPKHATGGEALHTSTFAGNPLGCAAALAVLDLLDARLAAHVQAVGARLLELLRAVAARQPAVRDVRGKGLLVGVELDSGTRSLAVMRALLERGYITVPAGSDARVISLTPPLGIELTLLEGFVVALEACLEESAS
jgi:4-aminobutyrate aminotransferase-like enzyme